jgi:hypothetical protein
MKRFFKILVCAIALFAFTNVAEAQQPEGKKLLLNIVRKVKPEHVTTLRDSFLKCRVETLKEEGCERYEIYQSARTPQSSLSTRFGQPRRLTACTMQHPTLRFTLRSAAASTNPISRAISSECL